MKTDSLTKKPEMFLPNMIGYSVLLFCVKHTEVE